jgi:hypothetical protein
MELLNVGMARSVWLFDLRDMNPRGKYIEAGFIEWLKSLYHFSKYPSSMYDRDENGGLSFKVGGFQVQENQSVTVYLKVYTDGMVGETRSSTHDTDTFIEDVLTHVDCLLLCSSDAKSLQFFDDRLIRALLLQIGDEVLPKQTPELVLSRSG